MELNQIIYALKEKFPKKAIEISESLELLKEIISDTMDEINSSINKAYQERDFETREQLDNLLLAIYKYESQVDSLIIELEIEEVSRLIDDEETIGKGSINSSDYLVDSNVEHSLYEDFTHKRPCAFQFYDSKRIEVSTWKELLIKTCEILIDMDEEKFLSLETNPRMNGRKRKYFLTNPSNMTSPELVKNKIYVETNMNSNAFRNIIIKLLKEFGFKISDFKVFLRADYSEINR